MQAADFQNALAANDNSKRLTDVPKFYGNTKDTLTARDFLKRLEQAAAIGNWADKWKCAEFCHLLHSKANGFMTMTLKKAKVADDNWAGHKEVFLSFFDVKGTAKLNFFSLHEMKQGREGQRLLDEGSASHGPYQGFSRRSRTDRNAGETGFPSSTCGRCSEGV